MVQVEVAQIPAQPSLEIEELSGSRQIQSELVIADGLDEMAPGAGLIALMDPDKNLVPVGVGIRRLMRGAHL